MERRRLLIGLGSMAGLAMAGTVGALVGREGDGKDSTGSTTPAERATKKLEVRDLVEQDEASGTVGFGNSRQLALAVHGTVTALPAVGTIVDRGGELAEVAGQPVVLLFGERPAWRALPPPPDNGGADVEQLEANLIALGVAKAGALGPNWTWSDATTTAVKRWQKKIGVAETGAIDLGWIVFESGPVRITKHVAETGAQAGGPLLQVTDTARSVHLDLAAAKQAEVHVGDAVEVVLPSGATTGAKVASVGTAVQSEGQGDPTLPVELTFDDPGAVGDLDEAPVTVKITTSSVKDVLTAPVESLLALSEGGYAVELVTGPTTTKLVGVTLGPSADGWVQVTGDVSEGDEVVVAP
jgi:hypothetical protein